MSESDPGRVIKSPRITCPVCGRSTRIEREFLDGSRVVQCINPLCDSNLPPVEYEEK